MENKVHDTFSLYEFIWLLNKMIVKYESYVKSEFEEEEEVL